MNSTKPKSTNPFLNIAKRCGIKPFDMEEIVIEKIGLTKIEPDHLKLFPNLQVIYLNNNKLTELDNLNYCIRLETIDARGNQISHLHLPKQAFLKELYLADNNFSDVDEFIKEASNLRNLEVLDLRGNIITQVKGYRQAMIAKFQALKTLDGLEVLKSERMKANPQKNLLTKSGRTQKRPFSMFDFLRTAPISAPDIEVKKKSDRIRSIMEERKRIEEEEQTKAAREMREEFEAKINQDELPLPEGLDFLGQKKKLEPQPKPQKTRRAASRMYIKTATFAEKNEPFQYDKKSVFESLNSDIPKAATSHCLKESLVFPE